MRREDEARVDAVLAEWREQRAAEARDRAAGRPPGKVRPFYLRNPLSDAYAEAARREEAARRTGDDKPREQPAGDQSER